MSESKWVQHRSGDGEKWEVYAKADRLPPNSSYFITTRNTYHLPASEYCLCDPPETWVDITSTIEIIPDSTAAEFALMNAGQQVFAGIRLRKMQMRIFDPIETGDWKPGVDYRNVWAFIIERKQP